MVLIFEEIAPNGSVVILNAVIFKNNWAYFSEKLYAHTSLKNIMNQKEFISKYEASILMQNNGFKRKESADRLYFIYKVAILSSQFRKKLITDFNDGRTLWESKSYGKEVSDQVWKI